MAKKNKRENMEIRYVVERRNIKHPRLEFMPEALFIILPQGMKDEKEILKIKEKWIKKKYEEISEALEDKKSLLNKFLVFGEIYKINGENLKSLRKHLKTLLKDKLYLIINEYAGEIDTKFNKIFIRNQKTKWASCSSKRNLSFNLKLISLPEELIRYVVFHELLHLKERKHNHGFINRIKQKFKNFAGLEKMLFEYWFILNRNEIWKEIDEA